MKSSVSRDGVSEKISEAELVVMEALWEHSPQTANDVADRVAGARDWSVQTVKTLLSRLMAKEVIAADQDGRRFLYRPLIARDDYVASESGRLVNRLFGGRVSPLIAQFAQQDQLTAEDIAELEDILKGLKS
ncbi:beta-lactamase [Sphingobium ummariense RL-3]|uniref:Beta-lactamase n=1 Tax=Sphingobium ummariense RL-3 TaxID=1346791 RepID=T0IZ19_9SPHN|nr:beta-lactamase [Sphingobium ummariense RL-3]